ncbi:MAG TPA: ABC transporter permease [Clostridiales bacterium]|nr:ABC transporter permease [Clostridiales bacterium]
MPEHTITTKNAAREQAVRIVKRKELNTWKAVLLRAAAFVLALAAGGIFILMMGSNPLEAYAIIVKGAFVGSVRNPLSSIQATVIIAVPLLIVSLGLAFAFKMKFWNIGAEGQMIAGAIFASYFALRHSGMPHVLLLLTMFAAGAAGGGLWGLIPALFKVRFGTNETLFTLMLNYIALYFIKYLESGPWQGTKGFASIAQFDLNARLPNIGGIHAGWIVALMLVVLTYLYLNHSKHGYEISVVGESQATARYAGMNVRRIILRTMFISGAVCGIAGMIQVSGIDYTLSMGITGGVGFKGITVAWLAQLNPFVIAGITGIFSILEKGSGVLQSELGINAAMTGVLEGIILFFFLGCEFFIRYSFVFRKRRAKSS